MSGETEGSGSWRTKCIILHEERNSTAETHSADSLKAKENTGRQLMRKKNDEIENIVIVAEIPSSGVTSEGTYLSWFQPGLGTPLFPAQ